MAKKQKSGLYRSKVKIGVDANGKDINKWISGKTKRELEQARREVEQYYILGVTQTDDSLFGDYAVRWYTSVKKPMLSPSSQESYRTALNKHILPTFGSRRLRAITATELQVYLNSFAGCSRTKITMIAATLKGIFSSACQDRVIDVNPTLYLVKPSPSSVQSKRALTQDERTRIENACQTHPERAYLALMFYLGLRPGEARGVQWGDIDWTNRTIHIQRDIDFKAQASAGALKTASSNRIIPLPERLCAILSPLRGLPARFIVSGALSGSALSKASAERTWIRLMQACDLVEPADPNASDIRFRYRPLITPHTLRHNYATMCYEQGVDAYTAMRLLGHSSIKTTMDIYTHLSDAQLQKIAVTVDDMFSGTKITQKSRQT